MIEYTVNELLKGIKEHNQIVLTFIYKKYYRDIKFYIVKNSGNEDDAKDIFQEALIVIYKQIKDESLNLTCEFKTYLYSICRYTWLKLLDRKKRVHTNSFELTETTDLEDDIEAYIDDNEKYKLFQYHFEKLHDDCKKVLLLFLEKTPLKEIAETMGYKSEKYAKKKKYYCKEYLVNSIVSDPTYKELSDE